MENKTVVEFKNIDKRYDNFEIKDFNLKINEQEIITVIGSSGSGKTTILKMINGLVMPDSGSVLVNDEDIENIDIIKLRRNIGYVIQSNGLFNHMSVEKNICYVLSLMNKLSSNEIRKTAESLIDIVDLDKNLLTRFPDELSGGQQQRVGIARALAAKPKIILMDEPFGAVDEITRKQLQDEIQRIQKQLKVTIIFVTHDIDEALKLGDRVLIMQHGNIVQFDTPSYIIENPASEYVEKLLASYKK